MRLLAWLSLSTLLLTCTIWTISFVRAVKLQYGSRTRQVAVTLAPSAIAVEQIKPAPEHGLKIRLVQSDQLVFNTGAATFTATEPMPGLQLVHANSTAGEFITVALIRWWWMVIPETILTTLAWVVHLSRRKNRGRGFAVQ